MYETIRLNGAERNVERLGVFIAWLVSNNLLSVSLERAAGSAAAHVRLQDLTGAAFLTTVLHGEFKPSQLSEAGQGFVEDYFVSGRFNDDYNQCEYDGDNEWLRYDAISPMISAAYRRYCEPKPGLRARLAKVIKFPSR